MPFVLIRARDHIDAETEAHVHVKNLNKASTTPHTHDFYEIFLMLIGSVRHRVNGRSDLIGEGRLVFMRPDDSHYFESVGRDSSELVNLAFPRKTFERARRFLGEGFSTGSLLESPVPPTFELPAPEARELAQRMLRLGRFGAGEKAEARANLRALLAELYLEFFARTPRRVEAAMPAWLARLCAEMEGPERFTRGLAALRELAHKSPEHLCRAFRKHLGRTPTEYVNDLRLDHAARRLAESDEKVIAVARSAGFDNLSHFYHEFRRRYGRSPAAYRRWARRTAIP